MDVRRERWRRRGLLAAALADGTRDTGMRTKRFQPGWPLAGAAPQGLARRMLDEAARMRAAFERLGLRVG